MAESDYTKKDWKLFREKVPEWQEAYIEKLDKEYLELLNSDAPASERFWDLEKRINEDKHKKGVSMQMYRTDIVANLVSLIREGAITMNDLDEFSDEIKERVRYWTSEER